MGVAVDSSGDLAALIERFDPASRADLRLDIPRTIEAFEWLGDARSVLDIGGGHSLFAPFCALRGLDAVVTDSFDHPYYLSEDGTRDRKLLQETGATFVSHDAVSGDDLPFEDGRFDAVTSFDSLEHWHHSPRRLFREIARVTKPGGLLVLGAPNAVNARKRVGVLLGRTNWSRFDDWYYEPVFFGHVREPTVSEFERIGNDLQLVGARVIGRNWLGYRRGRMGRVLTAAVDAPLRRRASLCANLYLIGRFPG